MMPSRISPNNANNLAIIAVAGGRKTQRIVESCSVEEPRRRVAITYTTSGQDVLRSRLWRACSSGHMPEVMGWFTFLMRHIAKPYLPDVFPGIRMAGLHFVEQSENPSAWREGRSQSRYFDSKGLVYSNRLAELCCQILKKSESLVLARLERIFDEIYIDEVQDLVHYDLDILQALFRSDIRVTVVGDPRQSILVTSHGTNKNARLSGMGLAQWLRNLEEQGVLRVDEQTTSWRCNQPICDLADKIIATTGIHYLRTSSAQTEPSAHSGIFSLGWEEAADYIATHAAETYCYNKDTPLPDGVRARNIGTVKGETADHVVLFLAGTMTDYLSGRTTTLAKNSAMRLYVAVTRAKHSVAYVEKGRPDKKARRTTTP